MSSKNTDFVSTLKVCPSSATLFRVVANNWLTGITRKWMGKSESFLISQSCRYKVWKHIFLPIMIERWQKQFCRVRKISNWFSDSMLHWYFLFPIKKGNEGFVPRRMWVAIRSSTILDDCPINQYFNEEHSSPCPVYCRTSLFLAQSSCSLT